MPEIVSDSTISNAIFAGVAVLAAVVIILAIVMAFIVHKIKTLYPNNLYLETSWTSGQGDQSAGSVWLRRFNIICVIYNILVAALFAVTAFALKQAGQKIPAVLVAIAGLALLVLNASNCWSISRSTRPAVAATGVLAAGVSAVTVNHDLFFSLFFMLLATSVFSGAAAGVIYMLRKQASYATVASSDAPVKGAGRASGNANLFWRMGTPPATN